MASNPACNNFRQKLLSSRNKRDITLLKSNSNSNEKLKEPIHSSLSSNPCFSRDEIESHSPSRLDDIDMKTEKFFRLTYCDFLWKLGKSLDVPRVTIATAIVFSHRFFLRQSHLENNRFVVATACMFVAGKVEETPVRLKDVVVKSYELSNKTNPIASAKIIQKQTYEEQEEVVLVGAQLVLITLRFDINIEHPYETVSTAIGVLKAAAAMKKLKRIERLEIVAKFDTLEILAFKLVDKALYTPLCLQFEPRHIAVGAIRVGQNFVKTKMFEVGWKILLHDIKDFTQKHFEDMVGLLAEGYKANI